MTTAARVAATMMRAGRMTTSLCSDDPVGLGPQLDLAWSRGSDDRATRQARTGLDPVAINDRNEHASQAPRRFARTGTAAATRLRVGSTGVSSCRRWRHGMTSSNADIGPPL